MHMHWNPGSSWDLTGYVCVTEVILKWLCLHTQHLPTRHKMQRNNRFTLINDHGGPKLQLTLKSNELASPTL